MEPTPSKVRIKGGYIRQRLTLLTIGGAKESANHVVKFYAEKNNVVVFDDQVK
jgi:hypothetical protein